MKTRAKAEFEQRRHALSTINSPTECQQGLKSPLSSIKEAYRNFSYLIDSLIYIFSRGVGELFSYTPYTPFKKVVNHYE